MASKTHNIFRCLCYPIYCAGEAIISLFKCLFSCFCRQRRTKEEKRQKERQNERDEFRMYVKKVRNVVFPPLPDKERSFKAARIDGWLRNTRRHTLSELNKRPSIHRHAVIKRCF